jgi:transposase
LCGHELHQCGVETSEQLKIIPKQVSVIRHERAKYTCRHCEHTDTRSKIVTAPKPPSMIPKSIGCPETFAAVVTANYVDALPLYRQEAILTSSGIELSRTTLANWCVQLGSKVGVIVDEMKRHLLTEPVICADETTVQVLDEPKSALGKTVNYLLNQWPKLHTYLEDGRLSIDNNVTERDIRPFTTGRKNWMFSQSVGGAMASANLYSLVMTCRANDLNPYYYFAHLFRELPKRTSNDELSDLLPWNVVLNEGE